MSLQRYRRKLAGATFKDEVFEAQDLRGGIAHGAVFVGCTFRECKLGQGQFGGASFVGCRMEDCDLRQADLRGRFSDCEFVGCDFDQANFHSAIIERTVFRWSRLEYAIFSRATIVGGGFLDCQLHGAYFDLAESSGVDFSGSNLWGMIIPLSCAVIPENKFDYRQSHMFLALGLHADVEERVRKAVGGIVDARVLRMVERLIRRQKEDEEPGTEQEAEHVRAS